LVLGPIEAAEGVGPAGVGLQAVQRRFDGLDGGDVGGFFGTGNADGRHGTAAEATEHFFPAIRMFGGSASFEIEVPITRRAAVAAEAVFVDELSLGRLCVEAEGGQRHQAVQGPEREAAHTMNYTISKWLRMAMRPASTNASILFCGMSNSVVPKPFAGSRQISRAC